MGKNEYSFLSIFLKSQIFIFSEIVRNLYEWNLIGINALFVPTFRGHFYFGPYIYILPILIHNPINACYFSPFRQPTDENDWRG